MIRRVLSWLTAAGLLVSGGLWCGAAIASSLSADHPSLAIGYGAGEAWLVNAVINRSGAVWVGRFAPNLTGNRGLYCRASRRSVEPASLGELLLPRVRGSRFSDSFSTHLLVPIVLFGLLLFWAAGAPVIRRAHRRRRGLCVRCRYDLSRSRSGACPECGAPPRG